jgi:hypothetical protein
VIFRSPHPEALPRVRRPGRFLVALSVCLVFAILTRWFRLANECLWFDEGWTWWLVTQPVGSMFRLMSVDTCAPLYFYLLHFWSLLFGEGVFALRSMSAFLATAAIVPWTILARRTFVTNGAFFVAALLFSVSFMQTQYAREARPYALMGFVTLGALACVPTLAAKRSWPAMLGFAAGVVAGMYTHNTMAFYAASLSMAWLVWPGERPLKSRLIDLAIVVAISIVAYAPWVPTLREQAKWVGGNFWAQKPGFFEWNLVTSAVSGIDVYGVSPMIWVAIGRTPGAEGVAALTAIGIGLAIVLSAATRDAVARRKTMAIAIVAFAPLVVMFTLSRIGKPMFFPRLFIPTSLLTPLLFAMPVDRTKWVRLAGCAMACVLFVGGVTSVVVDLSVMQKDDWTGAYAYVKQLPPSSKRLLVFVAAEGELPYAHRAMLDPTRVQEPRTGSPQGFFELDLPRTMQRVFSEAEVEPLAKKLEGGAYDEVILALSHQGHVDAQGLVVAYFEREWWQAEETKFRNVKLVRYVRP